MGRQSLSEVTRHGMVIASAVVAPKEREAVLLEEGILYGKGFFKVLVLLLKDRDRYGGITASQPSTCGGEVSLLHCSP